MRQLRKVFRFTATEQALFYELVAICNGENWPDIFTCSNRELCDALDINEKTLKRSRDTLLNKGLIYYENGKSRRHTGRYSFVKDFREKQLTTVNNTVDVSPDMSGEVSGDTLVYKTKTQKDIEEMFGEFRKLYPGDKRSWQTELKFFQNKHQDWLEQLPLLIPAIKQQKIWYAQKQAANKFVSDFPPLKYWIRDRSWEIENPGEEKQKYYI